MVNHFLLHPILQCTIIILLGIYSQLENLFLDIMITENILVIILHKILSTILILIIISIDCNIQI